MLFVEQREMPLKNARQLISSLPKEEGGSHCESRSSIMWEPGTRAAEEAKHGIEYVRRVLILRRF